MGRPRKVMASAGHSVGKTFLGACLVNWWFDTRPEGICITTAPTDRQVRDLLWAEVRKLRGRAGLPDDFVGPKLPRLETGPEHYAYGFTARDATAFQGRHSPGGVLIIFDEAEGIEAPFWQALGTMLDDNSAFVAFYNPTEPGSACHLAEQRADEHGVMRRTALSCLDHPNVAAQMRGEEAPIPGAITLDQLRAMLLEDSMVLGAKDAPEPGDVSLAGVRYRPGPIAEARCLGRRPTSATTGLYGEALWSRLIGTRISIDPFWPVAIGCDVARYGDDSTVMMVRKGLALLHGETAVKQSTKQTAQRLRELCEEFRDQHNEPKKIPVQIDEGGIGGGVIDQADGYHFLAVNASRKPRNEARYMNVRSELWFNAREPALGGQLDISRLPAQMLARLKLELMVAKYRVLPGTDKLVVTTKEEMKALLGRSPDVADCYNLTLYPPGART